MLRSTLPFALLLVAAALSSAGCSTPMASGSCTPGRQVACACGGGREGYQVCEDDGSGYGACVGCDDAGGTSADGGADAAVDASPRSDVRASDARMDTAVGPVDTGVIDTGAPDIGPADTGPPDMGTPAPDVIMPVDTGPTFAWVWLDRGGPAFQPHACRPGPGVVDGMLVDPMAFFTDLVAGRDPNTWTQVLSEIEGQLWSCGVGQQRGSSGNVRGRLFLPTAACPDASPPSDDPNAMMLGVRQLPECWDHAIDVVQQQ